MCLVNRVSRIIDVYVMRVSVVDPQTGENLPFPPFSSFLTNSARLSRPVRFLLSLERINERSIYRVVSADTFISRVYIRRARVIPSIYRDFLVERAQIQTRKPILSRSKFIRIRASKEETRANGHSIVYTHDR